MKTTSRLAILSLIILLVAGSDQFTKAIAQEHLQLNVMHSYLADTARLQLDHNPGAFLGLGASLPKLWRDIIWTYGVGCLLLLILWYAIVGREMDRSSLISLALIFSGGASNLYDRFAYDGYVVDFMNVGIGPLRTGIFNIADMSIMGGALLILVSTIRAARKAARQANAENKP